MTLISFVHFQGGIPKSHLGGSSVNLESGTHESAVFDLELGK